MKAKHYFILLLASLVPAFFLFQRTSIIGADSYYFFNAICSITPMVNAPYFSQLFTQFMTCNVAHVFFVNWLVIFVCSVIVGFIGELFHENGWLAGLFVYLSPYFILELVKFEDDLLAFPFLFFAQYFYFKGEKLKAFVLVVLSALLLWKGAVIYLLPFSVAWLPLFGLAVIGAWFFLGAYLFSGFDLLLTASGAMENYPIFGILYLGPLLIGCAGFLKSFLEQKLKQVPRGVPELFVFLGIVFLNSKFVLHAMPLLAVGMVKLHNSMNDLGKTLLYAFVLGSLFSISMGLSGQVPNEDVWSAIDEAHALAIDLNKPLMNSWGLGYWVQHRGLNASAWGWVTSQDFNGAVVVVEREQDCNTIKEFNRYFVQVC